MEEFSSNLLAIYTKWCAQTFRPIFGHFAMYVRNFAKIVAAPVNENQNSIVPLKVQSLPKKNGGNKLNQPIHRDTTLVQIMSPELVA